MYCRRLPGCRPVEVRFRYHLPLPPARVSGSLRRWLCSCLTQRLYLQVIDSDIVFIEAVWVVYDPVIRTPLRYELPDTLKGQRCVDCGYFQSARLHGGNGCVGSPPLMVWHCTVADLRVLSRTPRLQACQGAFSLSFPTSPANASWRECCLRRGCSTIFDAHGYLLVFYV